MSLIEKINDVSLDLKIALDGCSASGKGLIGSMIAQEFLVKYMQSSITYRGLALICIEDRIAPEDQEKVIYAAKNYDVIERTKNIDLNTELIGEMASKISVISEVRKYMTHYLTTVMQDTPRIIMEGRDIGTVVCPDADMKIFITADVEVRAQRRYKQLQSEQKNCTLASVLESLKERDLRDKERDIAPLRAAYDALIIDTSNISPVQVVQKIKDYYM